MTAFHLLAKEIKRYTLQMKTKSTSVSGFAQADEILCLAQPTEYPHILISAERRLDCNPLLGSTARSVLCGIETTN